jgi:hypothetical protein
MKKVFLGITILAISLIVIVTNYQTQKIGPNKLIGYWSPDVESSRLFFWKDVNGNLQIQEISCTSGDTINVIAFEITENKLFIRTIFKPLKWEVLSKFEMINDSTLNCVAYTDEGYAKITYNKTK